MLAEKPASTGSESTADRITAASFKKPQPRMARPFSIIKMQTHTVVIGGEDASNAVPIQRVAAVSRLENKNNMPEPGAAQRTDLPQTMSGTSLQRTDQISKKKTSEGNLVTEWTVKAISRNNGYVQGRRYATRCCGHGTEDDRLRPAKNIF